MLDSIVAALGRDFVVEGRAMRLAIEDVEHVAALARLGLTADEKSTLRDQLSSILEHIDALSEIDTDAIPPTAQVIDLVNVLREDRVESSLPRSSVLANAPRQREGFFEVDSPLGGGESES